MNFLIKHIMNFLFCSTLIINLNSPIIIKQNENEIIKTLMRSFVKKKEAIKIARKLKYILIDNQQIDHIVENIYLKKMLQIYSLVENIQNIEYLELELKKPDQLIKHESTKLINEITQSEILVISILQNLNNLEEEIEPYKTSLIEIFRTYASTAKSLVKNIKIKNILLKNNKLYSEKRKIILKKLKMFRTELICVKNIFNEKTIYFSDNDTFLPDYSSISQCLEAIELKIKPYYLTYLLFNKVIQKEVEENITFLNRTYIQILTLRVTNSNSYLVISYPHKGDKKLINLYFSLPIYYRNLTLMTLELEHSMNFKKIITMFQNMILINENSKTQINNHTMIKMFKKYLVNCSLIENYQSLHRNDKKNLVNKFHDYSQIMNINKKQKNFQNIKQNKLN